MEYSFRKSPRESETTVVLMPLEILVQGPSGNDCVPYAKVQQVRLYRSGGRFGTELRLGPGRRIRITSPSGAEAARQPERMRAYATFVRVLHLHLREKSKSGFVLAPNVTMQCLLCLAFLMGGILVSLLLSLAGISLGSPTIQVTGFGTAGLLMGFVFQRLSSPQGYEPSHIPLHFLP